MWTRETLISDVLDNKSIKEIGNQDMKWCLLKWHFMMGVTHAAQLDQDVFMDDYYGHLMLALENRIQELGGRVVPMVSVSAE